MMIYSKIFFTSCGFVHNHRSEIFVDTIADAGFSMARPCLGRPANREHAKAAVSFMICLLVVVCSTCSRSTRTEKTCKINLRSFTVRALHIFLFFPFP
jgi:hypothetical protein